MRQKSEGRDSRSLRLFFESKYCSIKHYKYFSVYDDLFSKYINEKITFVEIGVFNGGGLELWRKFFGNKARIIGIDLNPKCKKFEKKGIEIFIGDQSDPKFWKNFFKKVGKVDIILDDGGHTNKQQIITTISAIKHINDNGMLVCEDTHASYMEEFNNPSEYSFIEFVKKTINDVNFTFPNLNKYNFSLNKYIYSIQIFESIVCFNVSKKKCYINKPINNNKFVSGIEDLRYGSLILKPPRNLLFLKKFLLLKKIVSFLRLKIARIINKRSTKEIKIYFE